MSTLLVPVREWPVFAWSFIAYLLWLYCVPSPWRLESRAGMWLLSWCGYYAFHPCHDGMSMADVGAQHEQ
jgi:hypothetical protein